MAGGVGLLVNPGDHHALADSIVRLLSDKGLRDRLGIAARKRIEHKYNWDYTANSIYSAYTKAVS
jgi:glycosyltransferase involved in cell wall biosynthesis